MFGIPGTLSKPWTLAHWPTRVPSKRLQRRSYCVVLVPTPKLLCPSLAINRTEMECRAQDRKQMNICRQLPRGGTWYFRAFLPTKLAADAPTHWRGQRQAGVPHSTAGIPSLVSLLLLKTKREGQESERSGHWRKGVRGRYRDSEGSELKETRGGNLHWVPRARM